MSAARIGTPDEVLSFWFTASCDRDLAAISKSIERWMLGTPAFDAEIQARFGATLEAARRGDLDGWLDAPRSCLALIIVLDQFSRNAFRGTPRAYAQDARAISALEHARARGFLASYTAVERIFALLPVAHSEDLAVHDRWFAEHDNTIAVAPATLSPAFERGKPRAASHRAEIVRFGRHPRRNVVLGRVSTDEEKACLAALRPPETLVAS